MFSILKKRKKACIFLATFLFVTNFLCGQVISTVADVVNAGAIGLDKYGNIYIHQSGSRVLRLDAVTKLLTQLNTNPAGDAMGVDPDGNVYYSQRYSLAKLSVDGTERMVCGFVDFPGGLGDDGLATRASMTRPGGVATDSAGNVYFSDFYVDHVRKITVSTGIITGMAGNYKRGYSGDGGPADSATLRYPRALTVDDNGNVYFTDSNNVIRRVDAATDIITTFAGTGTVGFSGDGGLATEAQLNFPSGLANDRFGNLYIVDRGNQRIRKVSAKTGIISTIAGTGNPGYNGEDIPATSADLNSPFGIALDSNDNIFISDVGNRRIRMITNPCANSEMPYVELSASNTRVTSIGEQVTITAVNNAGGGTSPLFTFAKDKDFIDILQAEGYGSTVTISANDLANGPNWFYVKMKSSDSCVGGATDVDSINIVNHIARIGIIDNDFPTITISTFPNPFTNHITILGLQPSKNYTIKATDNFGRRIYEHTSPGSNSIDVSTVKWSKGLYWISIYDKEKNKLIGTIPVLKQ